MNSTKPALVDLEVPPGGERLESIVTRYQSFQVLVAALELEVFDFLESKGPSTREQIAQGIHINGMFSRSFLDSLVDLGVLVSQEEKYSLTDIARQFLTSTGIFYQGDRILNAAHGARWDSLADSLRQMQPAMGGFANGPSESFIRSLGQGALRGELQTVTKAVTEWDGFAGSRSLLDLGGGHGLYAIALCQANPELRGVVFDKPHVIPAALRFIEDYDLQDRLAVLGGDMVSDSFGTGFDIVLVSHLLYKFRKELGWIFKKVADSLEPGGLLVTNHWFCAPGCGAGQSAIQELAIALQSFGHPMCRVEEFEHELGQHGFRVITTGAAPTLHGPTRLQLAVKDGAALGAASGN